MALAPGVRLGPYEVLAAIGKGGMGEVYKARDTRLDRTVAIKVLPEHVASDPELKQRFEREAKTISSLNHPHICTLYDVGSQDGIDFLVMEHLEGETLGQRLTKGALPLDQALKTAIEIADALDKAHRQGITHRDLKPGNIMLTKAGAKLLDFGLAKLRPGGAAGAVGLSDAPTISSPLTGAGSILGTFQYMAPEQLEGQEADARTDIFAFGAVVYEMVTGKKAFEGKSQASLIAAILEREPTPISDLQPMSPPALDRVVKKCLAKEPDRRWQAASDLQDELQWIADAGSQVGVLAPAADVALRSGRNAQSVGPRVLLLLTAAAVILVAVMAGVLALCTSPSEAAEMRLEVGTPETSRPGDFALSADGQQLVFVANGDNGPQLWLRRLDSERARPLTGTEGGRFPFWSPDSRSIGFFADASLKRIDVGSSRPLDLAAAPFPNGGAWNNDGEILLAPSSFLGDVVSCPELAHARCNATAWSSSSRRSN